MQYSQFTHWCVCHRIVRTRPRTRQRDWTCFNEAEFINHLIEAHVWCRAVVCWRVSEWQRDWMNYVPGAKNRSEDLALRCPSQQTRLRSTCHPNNRFTSSFTFPLVSALSLSPLGPPSSLTPPPLVWPTGIILRGRTKDIVGSHLQIFWPVLILRLFLCTQHGPILSRETARCTISHLMPQFTTMRKTEQAIKTLKVPRKLEE